MTKWMLRHKTIVVFAWLLLAVAGYLTQSHIRRRLDYSYTTPGQPGYVANSAITERFGLDATFETTLPVLRLPEGKGMDTPEGQAIAERTFDAANHAGYLGLSDYANTHDAHFILDGGKVTWAMLTVPNPDTGDGTGRRIDPSLKAAMQPGTSLSVTGFERMLSNKGSNSQNRYKTTTIGLIGAFLVLLLVYGSWIALLPVLTAIPAMFVTYLALYSLTYVTHVSYFIPYMITTLTVGISIDFALIVVIRWREERERGRGNEEAVIVAGDVAGRAVMLSGLTAAIGLFSLVVLPVPFLRSIGVGAMVIPFVPVAISVTLLPIALAVLGPALDKHKFWSHSTDTSSRPWTRWAQFVLKHKWSTAIVGIVVLAALALPGLRINTGEPLISSLSPNGLDAAREFQHLQANGIPGAVDFPIYAMVHGGDSGRDRATEMIRATPGVFDVMSPATRAFRRGDDSLLLIVPTIEGPSAEGKHIVLDLRQRLSALPSGAEVGGSTAGDIAFTDAVYGHFPLLITLTSLVTFVVLTLALRSVVLALKAVVMNVISLGAAFGFMVYFWQEGHGSNLIYGLPATGAIRAWIPTVVFASLFGLSMDYEVFVLTRMREEYDRTGSTDQAVIAGLSRTGRLVTCAALILMVTFLSISLDPNQLVKIVASTSAMGIVVDAVIVRTLLVPAIVALMGKWNWWMPAWLSFGAKTPKLATHL